MFIVWFFFMLGLYLVPTIVVMARHHPNPAPTIIINLLLGWTFIGWVIALAMAFGNGPQTAVIVTANGRVIEPAKPVFDESTGKWRVPQPGELEAGAST